ncbi:hypothetical protein ASG12_19180 [Williamsia sp. Leaf354]|uniref:hypothetical protein n=1 Tax=Williamsia sp. Leaf354 TaxID=1736349 RepID=UPI0006F32F6C|nr:hypothetical protein [Williamsia sp. Leaf354]KQR96305.1 hypothetical protein ASG12_19180 [Williamsia sp. Leaf354]
MNARRHLVAGVAVVVALVFVALAVWLALTSVTTADYPPLTIDDRTVGGPYSLTTYSGNRIGGATACVLAAVIATYVAVTRVLPRRRGDTGAGALSPPSPR